MKTNTANTNGQAEVIDSNVQPLVVRAGGKQWVIGREPIETTSFPTQDSSAPLISNEVEVPASEESHETWLDRTKRYVQTVLGSVYESVMRSLDLLLQHEVKTKTHSNPVNRASALVSVRRFRDSFQSGIIIGLALGCLSLVLFHQMNSGTLVAETSQPAAQLTIPGYNSLSMTVPAGHIYSIQVGSYSTKTAAVAAQSALRKKGVPATVHQLGGSGQAAYTLLTGVAIYAQDLNSTVTQLNKLGLEAKTVPLVWNAKLVPLNSWSVTSSTAKAISHWLSADMSTLNALTAAISDGAAKRDARTAANYSKALQPPTKELQGFSQGKVLLQVSSATEQAINAFDQGQVQTAQMYVAKAYENIQFLL